MECFDMRAKKPVGYLDAAAALGTVSSVQRRHGALRHGSCHAVGCAVAAGVRMLLATFWCCCGVVAMLLTEVAGQYWTALLWQNRSSCYVAMLPCEQL